MVSDNGPVKTSAQSVACVTLLFGFCFNLTVVGAARRYDFFPHFFLSLFQSQTSGFATQAI